MAKYLIKANDDVLSFCKCQSPLAAAPSQLDCPWCGCGWLISCMACGKAFTFAQVVDVDRTYVDLMRVHFEARNLEVTAAEIAEAAASMERMISPLRLGQIVIYLDGAYFPLVESDVDFDGWFATHTFDRLPHAIALEAFEGGKRVLNDILGKSAYWLDRELPDHNDSEE